jgi:hypothetical protein
MYIVTTNISLGFPSFRSHSVPFALLGVSRSLRVIRRLTTTLSRSVHSPCFLALHLEVALTGSK